MSLRLRCIEGEEVEQYTVLFQVLRCGCLGGPTLAVLEETYGEGSAEGESWRPVETIL